jgi:hypothetical protein
MLWRWLDKTTTVSRGVANAWAPGRLQTCRLVRVRAIHGCSMGDASSVLLASFQKIRYPAIFDQPLHRLNSASSSKVRQGAGIANKNILNRNAPESSARPSCSIQAACLCNTTTLVDSRCRSACGSQSAHITRAPQTPSKHGRKNAPAP